MRPTYHYDKNGRMINESDYVRCYDKNEGRVEWKDGKWILEDKSIFGPEIIPLNLYTKDQLEIV